MADDPKLAEFRENNIKLTKENEELTKRVAELTTRYDGIDPDAVKADRAKLSELEKANATERAAHADTRKRADGFAIESAITDVFARNGGRPEARQFVIAQAAGQFTVENGEVKGTKFSPDRPGQPISVDEWVTLQTRQNAFCFLPSIGGGARPQSTGSTSGVKVLKNPTPQDLGRYAKDIAKGDLKVIYE
jgi:hypothetical protein